jgi:queuine tRNA-ribosyltransferase
MTEPGTFEVLKTDSTTPARRGRLITPHGTVDTPAFMPVGTQGTVKAVTPSQLQGIGAGIILSNAYHLFIRPGDRVIHELGGLHAFMGWPGPILTDSGGYQVFSLSGLRKVDDDGVRFRSHLDGSPVFLTPEKAVEIQAALGADVAMVLDDCLGYPSTHREARVAMERSVAWARRCRSRFGEVSPPGQTLFGIVQGGVYPDLRAESIGRLQEIGFEGYAIGGLAVGEPVPQMYDIVEDIAPALPARRPRYLMGVGRPRDLIECVARGIDLFDCVMPTRHARNGWLFTASGHIVIRNARYRQDPGPIDSSCRCPVCTRFSRAYLRHLFVSREILASVLGTIHNLFFYLDTMSKIRHFIESERFSELLTVAGAQ